MTCYNMQAMDMSAKRSLIGNTMDKMFKNDEWKYIYYNYRAESIMLLDTNKQFKKEKKSLLKSGEVDYNPSNSPFNYNNITFKISNSCDLILKPHRFIYKDEDRQVAPEPLNWCLEGMINGGGYTYYEFVRIDKH